MEYFIWSLYLVTNFVRQEKREQSQIVTILGGGEWIQQRYLNDERKS